MRDYGSDLYVFACGEDLVKIGRSSNCQRRLKEVRSYMPFLTVELAWVGPGSGWLENTAHYAFDARRCGKKAEWFRISKEEAIQTCQMFTTSITKIQV